MEVRRWTGATSVATRPKAGLNASELELRKAYATWQPHKPRPTRQRACGAGLIEELEYQRGVWRAGTGTEARNVVADDVAEV
jgi:hypothetical protein